MKTTNNKQQTTNNKQQTNLRFRLAYFVTMLTIFSMLAVYSCSRDDSKESLLKSTTSTTQALPLVNCYEPTDPNCTPQNETITANFAGCPLIYTYKVQRCNGAIKIYGLNWSFPPNPLKGACNNLFNLWNSYQVSGNISQLKILQNSIMAFGSQKAQEYEVSRLNPAQYPCSSGQNNISVEYIAASCYRWCMLDGIWQESVCGNGCCTRTVWFCFDSTGKPVKLDEGYFVGAVICANQSTGPCPQGTGCDHDCRRIYPYTGGDSFEDLVKEIN